MQWRVCGITRFTVERSVSRGGLDGGEVEHRIHSKIAENLGETFNAVLVVSVALRIIERRVTGVSSIVQCIAD